MIKALTLLPVNSLSETLECHEHFILIRHYHNASIHSLLEEEMHRGNCDCYLLLHDAIKCTINVLQLILSVYNTTEALVVPTPRVLCNSIVLISKISN